VAVIQISKIQVRRGKKISNTGVPQLSSAEFAWAIDSQELFIGNGSITEGAPYVGNTKILTEHDNILELAAAYRFASTDPAMSYSVSRSLQSKLDEYVSIADFIGDTFDIVRLGNTDCTAAFQYAFSELFQTTNATYKKVLVIPNGNYLFTQDLRIPSTAIIQGEAQGGVTLNIGSNNIYFITEDGDEVSTSVTSVTRPKNVNISNLTIFRTSGQFVLTGLGDSKFSNVTFLGDYEIPIVDITTPPLTANAALVWQNSIIDLQVDNVTFTECKFEKNLISVKCLQSFPTETKLFFTDCKFYENDIGVYINGEPDQSNRWVFLGTTFELIAKQAFVTNYGTDTLFDSCQFSDCGNGINNASGPKYPIVEFGQNKNNRLINCNTNRTQAILDSSALTASGFSDALNASAAKFIDRNYANIYKTDGGLPLAVFDTRNRYFYVEYFLKLNAYSRVGKLTITLDDDHTNSSITDEYQYSPFLTTDRGGALMTNFEFAVSIQSRSGDSTEETLVLSYTNPTATGETGSISYNISYGA